MVKPAKSKSSRRIAIVLYDDMQLLDATGPIDVFAQANRRAGGTAYEIAFVATKKTITTTAGLSLNATPLTDVRGAFHTLLVPGAPEQGVLGAFADKRLMQWIARTANAVPRVASVCSGVFLLAELGLLNGRRVTTHWVGLDALIERYPNLRIERDALFVEDGRFWSSAGVTAGIDLALALVTRDLGRDIALQVARDLVLHLVRAGGQSQFAAPLSLQARSGPDLARLIPWLEVRLDNDVSVADMADVMGMSERTFHRRCLQSFDMPPAKLLSELRLERARTLLCDSGTPVQAVAARCGFKDPTAFSAAFDRRFGASPTNFRRAFADANA